MEKELIQFITLKADVENESRAEEKQSVTNDFNHSSLSVEQDNSSSFDEIS